MTGRIYGWTPFCNGIPPNSLSNTRAPNEVPSDSLRHPPGRAGFTLLEVMVVLAIMGIALSLAVVNMEPSAGQILERKARRMALTLEAARDEAVFTGRPVGWRIRGGEFAFYTPDGAGEWALADMGLAVHAQDDGAVTGELFVDGAKADDDVMAFFLPHGFGSTFSVTLVFAGRSATVHGDRLGRIKMDMAL